MPGVLTQGLIVAVLALLLAQCDSGPTVATRGALVPVGEPTLTKPGNFVQAAGRVQNTSTQRPYSGVVQVTLFGADGRVAAVLQGAVQMVPPGGEVSYLAAGGDAATQWTRAEVQITAQIAEAG